MKNNELSLKYEQKLWDQDKTFIVGIDEAGRGPLAGPVVAAAVIFEKNSPMISAIDDSKKLTDKKRESLYDQIYEQALSVGIGLVDSDEIDKINILQATHKAMRKAVGNLKVQPDHLLVDGRPIPEKVYPHTAIIGGDRKCYSIAAASIIAKVYRDRLMKKYNSVFPGYGFEAHKGYGTKKHREAIINLLPSPIHRKSFARVKEYIPEISLLNKRQIGKIGEDQAAFFLHKKGFTILERNFHLGAYGELDIIAQKDDLLAFVEVKTQTKNLFGAPETWVDERKMKQIALIADGYLSQHPEYDVDCRFDVIGITVQNDNFNIRYMPDAFRL